MSSEKNPEVVGCDASIMRNVWEIREREYGQKIQAEQERIEKSALPSINKDWANRLNARSGTSKRTERKAKHVENQTDNSNVWKSKQPQVPPTLPYGIGSGPLGRPGSQRRGFSTPTPNYKDKKGQNKNFNRLQLLMYITQTQPSAMVWGKSWKYNKSVQSPEHGISDWGKCWMFATQQPYSEAGKPWINGPNMIDPNNLHLWKKPDYRVVESNKLDLNLPTDEWQMSWRKSSKNNAKRDTSSGNGENIPKSQFFTLLGETRRHNEALCSSEWGESWRSTKPANQQDIFTVLHDGLMNESVLNKQDKNREMSSKWEECWRYVNHHGRNKSKLHQVRKSYSPEWADSWRVATMVFKNHMNSDSSRKQDYSDTSDDCSQRRESHLHKIILVPQKQKYRDLYMLCNEFKALSEWSKSWQVTKNNSKPSEEIEKVLKVSSSRTETALEAQKVEKSAKVHYSTKEEIDPCYEQLKYNVIYHPKRTFTQSKLLLKHPQNPLSVTEWRDAWKMLKHRMRMERRRMRPDPSRPFRESGKGGDKMPSVSEWKNSWKFTCQPLHQEPELWQQRWSTTPQIRVDRVRDQNHFALVELPKNGPTGERNWRESWRFSRPRHQSEIGQGSSQTSQGRSTVSSHHPDSSWTHGSVRYTSHARSVSDWQEAWMMSETPFHHDKPSLTQWREAWKCSVFNTEHWTEQVSTENRVDVLMEILPQREKISLEKAKAKLSRSFDNQIFGERYPDRQWGTSWRAGSLQNHELSHCRSSGIPGKSLSSITQQHTTTNGHGSKWGMSFRIANPMPHVEQPWLESSPNPRCYTVMWSRRINVKSNINTNYFTNNSTSIRIWGNSHWFLQRDRAQIKDKTKSKASVDPWVIIAKKIQTRKHLYSNIEKEKQSERKWAGCHLLGKTQPRPKRGPASVKQIKMEDESKDKFLEEWAESWRFLVGPSDLKKKIPFKSLSGWNESWKFLLPPYQQMNGPKAK